MQYHASFITADGAYHCPVGSIMAIFIISEILTSAWNSAQRTGDKDQETEKMNFLLGTNIGRHQSQHSFTLTLSLPQQLPAEVK